MKPELLVMAAGLGSRFGGLKQLEPVGPSGESIMDYSLFDAKRAGVESVVFVIRREIEGEFHQRIGSRFAKWMDVTYAFQDIDLLPVGFDVPQGRLKPWGTAHAILAAKNAIKASFIAINADDFYGFNAFHSIAEWLSSPANPETSADVEQFAFVAFQMVNTLSANGTVARGVCNVSSSGLLKTISEYTALETFNGGARDINTGAIFTGLEPVSMNFWGFRPGLFAKLEELFVDFLNKYGRELKSEFYIPSAVDSLISAGQATVQVLSTPDRWFGVTYREDRDLVVSHLRELVKSGQYPSSLWG
jgi:dTDP-glucose pyrophosphorylase